MSVDETMKPRERSPRFPGLSLEEAIARARKIYDGVHRSPTDSLTAFRLMGFAGKGGASTRALGAIRQFGLIDGQADKTRISDLALRIFEPASTDERDGAIRAASTCPALYRQLLDRFDGRIPPADEPVRAFLIREAGFSKSGCDEFLASFRATLNYAAQFGEEQAGEDQAGEATDPALQANADEPQAKDPSALAQNERGRDDGKTFRLPLARDCVAEVRFDGPVSVKAINNLIRHFELMQEVWAEE